MDRTGYGDSIRTGDNKYVLASFRADAHLNWVIDLRSYLSLPELKYRDYVPRRHQVNSNPAIQANLSKGLLEAELTIIDVEYYKKSALLDLLDSGAEPGDDFDLSTLHNMAADSVLRSSPFGLSRDENLFGFPADGTPLRRPSLGDSLRELPNFDPKEIRRKAGGKLKDVQVLVARAHSIMSPTEFREIRMIVNQPMLRMNFSQSYNRLQRLSHVFDVEHAKSLPLLNDLVGQLAEASGTPHHVAEQMSKRIAISETASVTNDHIQAADFAAGWAADLLLATDNDYRALARKVRWVGLNGLAVPA